MPSPILACLGDIHLDTCIWRKLKHVTGDAYLGYKQFIDVAKEHKVPAVVVGDLFDSNKPDPVLVKMHCSLMDYAKDNNVPVWTLQGNHDKASIPWSSVHPWPECIGDGTIRSYKGHRIAAKDYALMDDIHEWLLSLERSKPDLVFMHQAAKQVLKFEGAWNCDLDFVPEAVKLVVMGDIHQELEMPIKGGKAFYTGAGHARDIGQVGPKSVLLVNDDLSITRQTIKSRNISKVYVTKEEHIQACKDFIGKPDNGLPNFLWICHTPELFPLLSRMNDENTTSTIIYLEATTEEEVSLDLDNLEPVTSDLSVDELVKSMGVDDQTFRFVMQLMDRGSPIQEVIALHRDKICQQ
jgi:DNA repair exonuclease SbcCD nuclease subunit